MSNISGTRAADQDVDVGGVGSSSGQQQDWSSQGQGQSLGQGTQQSLGEGQGSSVQSGLGGTLSDTQQSSDVGGIQSQMGGQQFVGQGGQFDQDRQLDQSQEKLGTQ